MSGLAAGWALRMSRKVREQDVAVLVALAALDEDLAGVQVYVVDLDVGQLAHTDRGVEEEPEHDLVLEVAGLVHDLLEPPEAGLGKDLGKSPRLPSPAKSQLLPDLGTHPPEALIVQPGAADKAGDLPHQFRV